MENFATIFDHKIRLRKIFNFQEYLSLNSMNDFLFTVEPLVVLLVLKKESLRKD